MLPTAQMQQKILQTHILPPRSSLTLLHAPKSKAQTPSDSPHSSASRSILLHQDISQQLSKTRRNGKISNLPSSLSKKLAKKKPSLQLTPKMLPDLPFSPQNFLPFFFSFLHKLPMYLLLSSSRKS